MYRIIYYRALDDCCKEIYVQDSEVVEMINDIQDADLQLVTLNYLEVIKK